MVKLISNEELHRSKRSVSTLSNSLVSHYKLHAIVSYVLSSGTAGYTIASQTWVTLKINTLKHDKSDGNKFIAINTTNNTFTLKSGTYFINVVALIGSDVGVTNRGQLRLYNTTSSATQVEGENFFGWDTGSVNKAMHLMDYLVPTVETTYRLEAWVLDASGASAQYASSTPSTDETYLLMHVAKVA
jgi:hypothetical protein